MKNTLLATLLLFAFAIQAQILKPGFNKEEYQQLMLISVKTAGDTEYASQFPQPEDYSIMYQSQPMAMDNLWDLWISNRGNSAVISLRGTTQKSESWLLNFYAAMVPAKGQLKWGDDHTFDYNLSDNPKAAVHAGWLVGMAFLSEDILPKIEYLYAQGVKDFYIVGHSQGGGIAYLLSSHLAYLKTTGKLPQDLQFKTYCSAAPKPGNLYYAYSFESQFQNGWAFNVINAADWVPEVPVSVQTLDDFNSTNPFIHAEDIIAKQSLTKRIALNHVYKKLNKPTRKAQKNYQKYLGDEAHKMVMQTIEGLEVPAYVPTSNYVRTGTQIVLQPDAAYYQVFPDDSTKIFTHHFHRPYLYLTEKLAEPFYEKEEKTAEAMPPKWELTWFDHKAHESWDYKTYQPFIQIDMENELIAGTSGCNRFSGSAKYEGSTITYTSQMMMTKRACKGIDEQAFVNTLRSAESFYISEDQTELVLLNNQKVIMKFKRGVE